MIRFYCKIIVEQSKGCWIAWFQDVPDIKLAGETPDFAVRHLLERFGEEQFQSAEISAVDHATYDGHFEYMIPLRHFRRVPIPLRTDKLLETIDQDAARAWFGSTLCLRPPALLPDCY